MNTVQTLPPAAIDAPEASRFCGVGETLWWELTGRGDNPAPIQLGRRKLWVVAELQAWLLAGAPRREQWEAVKKTKKGTV